MQVASCPTPQVAPMGFRSLSLPYRSDRLLGPMAWGPGTCRPLVVVVVVVVVLLLVVLFLVFLFSCVLVFLFSCFLALLCSCFLLCLP